MVPTEFTITLLVVFLAHALATPIRRSSALPSYVLDYAPILWLSSADQYNPADISQQLIHTTPKLNSTPITNGPSPLTLSNLNALNAFGNNGENVYLTSVEGITANPSWFNGVTPDSTGLTPNAISCTIVTVEHDSGLLDAFYFYFYAYNQGNRVFSLSALELGDHVGDWEHTMVRFSNGTPQAIWLSQHADGEAFTYAAMEKRGIRPVVYSAQGSHANYGTTGTHGHTLYNLNLPIGPIEDHCNQGRIWDPSLSYYAYSYDGSTFSAYDGESPVEWLYYLGQWGDAQLPDNAPGQVNFLGERKYVAGPTGPVTKTLERTAVCPSPDECIVRPVLTS